MTRTRASARAAGARFERVVADYLATQLGDDRIDRRPKMGAKDRGDIAAVRVHGQRVVIECKDTALLQIGPWLNEAEVERGNDDALVGLVVAKRHGIGNPADQIVVMTLADLVALMSGSRPSPSPSGLLLGDRPTPPEAA